MRESVLSIGTDHTTTKHLVSEGFMIFEDTPPSPDAVCRRVDELECGAVLFGTGTVHGSACVAHMRQQNLIVPVIRIEPGPRGGSWSLRCIKFLDSGADDVLEGPPHPEEVAASLRARLRMSHPVAETPLMRESDGISLEMNPYAMRVKVNDQQVALYPSEIRLLFFLANAPGAVSRADLNTHRYGMPDPGHDGIEVLICKLRSKLGAARTLLITHKGRGYELIGRVS